MPALELTDTIEITAVVANEKPVAGDQLLLWVDNPSVTTKDETAGAKLDVADSSSGEEDENAADDDGGLVAALARELKGQRWDSENSAWR
jgi:hypothetical protein